MNWLKQNIVQIAIAAAGIFGSLAATSTKVEVQEVKINSNTAFISEVRTEIAELRKDAAETKGDVKVLLERTK